MTYLLCAHQRHGVIQYFYIFTQKYNYAEVETVQENVQISISTMQ